MAEHSDTSHTEPRPGNGDRDDTVARLLHLAGPRPAIPQHVERRVEARVRREWRKALAARRARRWAVPAALAAGLALAAFVGLQSPPAPGLQPVLGTVARVLGGGAGGPVSGAAVRRGEIIETGVGRSLSIDLDSGISVRIAPGSALRFEAADELALLRGELYADTGESVYRQVALRVDTPLATVSDVGTQFSVRYAADGLRVAVREGRVDVVRQDRSHTAAAGDLLRLAPGREIARETVAPHAGLWDWAVAVAPVFDLDNRSLMEFLKWAARETGRELVFADDTQRMAAMRAVQHGSIEGFTPEEAIESVLATSGFDYRVTAERIFIGKPPAHGN